ncbi:LytTR family DNA-binding domain-containing protein [Reyranella sp. CPCC 100927]|uniref:LytR/AlgR family response regulator transcription factor n=1 Tax=Reyranella sp. CPCC 100927 TaxID=2599616 RepID=UPI0015B41E5D|nr:LytTR family DNA-binding domain-containing protein [Reyranella sp. CPCC 100927]
MPDDAPTPPPAVPPTWRQRFGAWLYRQRIAAAWVIVLVAITVIAVATVHADALRHGRSMTLAWAILLEGSSHLMIGAMVPALYWFHRRFPPVPLGRNLLAHAAITVPFSLVHVLGMFALRWAIAPLLGRTYSIQLDLDTLFYEYRKDAITYLILSTVLVALRYVFAEKPAAAATDATIADVPAAEPPADDPPPGSPAGRLERFAVRRKDKEILVSAQDIAWIEAAGNYAILHVGGETYDIRSSLSRLEAELDPSRFVRVHKSYIVNVERVREVEPWISGDSRLKLDDGAVVSLSRRYRPRFEKVVPVRT